MGVINSVGRGSRKFSAPSKLCLGRQVSVYLMAFVSFPLDVVVHLQKTDLHELNTINNGKTFSQKF